MTNLSKKLGEMNFDGLFTDVVPAVQVRGGIIRKHFCGHAQARHDPCQILWHSR